MKRLSVLLATLFFLTSSSWAEMTRGPKGRGGPKIQQPPTVVRHTDGDLQAKARRSLQWDADFSYDARNVNIKVRGGRALIQGFVKSPQESEALTKRVLAIDGVKAVENKTSVRE